MFYPLEHSLPPSAQLPSLLPAQGETVDNRTALEADIGLNALIYRTTHITPGFLKAICTACLAGLLTL